MTRYILFKTEILRRLLFVEYTLFDCLVSCLTCEMDKKLLMINVLEAEGQF